MGNKCPPTLAENVFTVFRRRLRQEVFRRRLRPSESSKQWFERQRTRACVPHTPYTSVLKFVPPAGRVCGAATHAVGGDVGYSLLADYHEKYNKMLHWHEPGNNPYGLN